MSSGVRVSAEEARKVADGVVGAMLTICEQVCIAGSLRRGSATVGDVEIVANPYHAPELLARMDRWVATGEAQKAVYSDGHTRWGEKYRGLQIPGFDAHVEVFIADNDNFGAIYWLRTGPGDANTYVMQACSYQNAPYRARGGYWCIGEPFDQRLTVADEREVFRLLGMPVIEPANRSVETYQRYLSAPKWVDSWTLARRPRWQQGSLF